MILGVACRMSEESPYLHFLWTVAISNRLHGYYTRQANFAYTLAILPGDAHSRFAPVLAILDGGWIQ